jgi:hypothetical protein
LHLLINNATEPAAFAATRTEVVSGRLALVSQTFFLAPVRYRHFAEFERKVIAATHTEHRLSPELIGQERARFESHMTPGGAQFAAPFRVDLLQKPGAALVGCGSTAH